MTEEVKETIDQAPVDTVEETEQYAKSGKKS